MMLYLVRMESPGEAGALLDACWSSMSLTERRALIPVMRQGLDAGDLPWLERWWPAGDAELTVLITRLLLRLPDSFLAQFVWRNAKHLLAYQQGDMHYQPGLGEEWIKQKVPAPVFSSPPSLKKLLGDMSQSPLSCVPPSYWASLWNLDREELIRAAGASDIIIGGHTWSNAVLSQWAEAAIFFADTPWISSLLDIGLSKWKQFPQTDPDLLCRLFEALPPFDRQLRIADWIAADQKGEREWHGIIFPCAIRSGHSWGEAEWGMLLPLLERSSSMTRTDREQTIFIMLWVQRCPVALMPQTKENIEKGIWFPAIPDKARLEALTMLRWREQWLEWLS